jgi:hypothetical protein
MVMIPDQYIGMDLETEPSGNHPQEVEKMGILAIIWKDLPFF